MLTVITSMEQELAGLKRELAVRAHAFGRSTPPAWRLVWEDMHVIGVGRSQGETVVQSLLRRQGKFSGYSRPPDRLLMLGFAGAVDPALETGTVVLSPRYYRDEPAGNPSLTSPPKDPPYSPPSQGGVKGGYLTPDPEMWRRGVEAATAINEAWIGVDSLTVDRLLTSRKAKQAVGRRYPVGVVNMEDYWVAVAARETGVPFLSARVVLDRADQALPGYLPGLARSRTRAVVTTAAMPWRIPALLGLARRLPPAQDVLTRFAFAFLAQLIDGESTQRNPAPAATAGPTGAGGRIFDGRIFDGRIHG